PPGSAATAEKRSPSTSSSPDTYARPRPSSPGAVIRRRNTTGERTRSVAGASAGPHRLPSYARTAMGRSGPRTASRARATVIVPGYGRYALRARAGSALAAGGGREQDLRDEVRAHAEVARDLLGRQPHGSIGERQPLLCPAPSRTRRPGRGAGDQLEDGPLRVGRRRSRTPRRPRGLGLFLEAALRHLLLGPVVEHHQLVGGLVHADRGDRDRLRGALAARTLVAVVVLLGSFGMQLVAADRAGGHVLVPSRFRSLGRRACFQQFAGR